jgi:adenylate kinase family enzyme
MRAGRTAADVCWRAVSSSSPSRIWITGPPGSGKTTLGRALAARVGLPHLELDALHHGPDWTPADPQEFRAAVAAAMRQPRWVIDGNYRGKLGTLVAESADLHIALDLPTAVTMTRLIRRTVWRGLTGRELWNGNREHLGNLLRRDPEQNIVLWAWTHRTTYHQRAVDAERDAWAGGPGCVRLRSAGQVRRFLRYLAG